MSAVAELTRALIAGGMDAGDAGELVARAATELAVPPVSKGALRTRRWRANLPSQTVTERHAVTPETEATEASPNVTDRHKPSPGDGAHISTSSETQEYSSKEEVRKLEAPRSKRPSRIPADWRLDQKHIDYAISKGIALERIPMLGEKFKNYFKGASGKTAVSPDWFRKWCTWCLNEIEWHGNRTNGQRPHHARRQSGADDFFAGLATVAADIDGHRDVAGQPDDDPPFRGTTIEH